jgi:histidinol-phosphate aminotransferase
MIFCGNGSDEVLAFAFAAFFETGEQGGAPVLFPDVTYSFYPSYCKLWGVPFNTVPLAGDFTVDLKDYFVPSGGVIFPNPNAPTGLSVSREAICELAAYTSDRNIVLVIDEAYAGFSHSGGLSVVADTARFDNLLVTRTLSQAASLAGLRAGFAIGGRGLIAGLERVRDSFNSYTLDAAAQAGSEAALRDGAYYDAVTARVAATRERTLVSLRALGFEAPPSDANFIFISPPGRDAPAFFDFLRARGIVVRHFNQERIAAYLRVSIGTDPQMDLFLDAAAQWARSVPLASCSRRTINHEPHEEH